LSAPATIRLRRDYLAANKGRRVVMPGFILLVNARNDETLAMRAGFTVTKKIGGAVVRNRMKRRLRALAHELLPDGGFAGADHVLIGRQSGIERDYGQLRDEMIRALQKVRK
jgi:ribonuclease P protein component